MLWKPSMADDAYDYVYNRRLSGEGLGLADLRDLAPADVKSIFLTENDQEIFSTFLLRHPSLLQYFQEGRPSMSSM